MRSTPSRALVILAVSVGLVGSTASQTLAQQTPDQQPGASSETPSKASDDSADVDARYKALTQKAAKAYADEDYKRALTLFEQAYELKQVPNLRYNMGRIEEKRGRFNESIAHYETFVGLAGVDIKARKDALDRLSTLREVVALRDKGEAVDEAKVDAESEDRKLAAANRAQNDKSARIERDYTLTYITLGLALASYGTSGYFALQARQANSDFDDATTRAARREAASSGQTSSIVADSMLGLGAVMTGLSIYFFLSPSETETRPDQTAMELSPQIGPDGAGMSFSVQF
jgi:tetratricopeptide (TPR) repeat protein